MPRAVSALARRVLYAAGAVLAWAPLVSAFVVPASARSRTVLVAFGALSALRPAAALLVFAAFVTIADPVAAYLGASMLRGPETMALTVLGGWCLSRAVRRREMPAAPASLRAGAAVLTCVVAASVFVTLATLQAHATFPADFARGLGRFLVREYLHDPGDYAALMQGAWLIEGAAVLFAVRAASLERPEWRDACVRMLVVGGAAAAALGIARFARALLQNVDPWVVVRLVLTGLRLPAHVTDHNAAGSGFALAVLLTLGLLLAKRRTAIGWSAVLAVLLAGFLLCASRSALAATVLVLLGFAAVSMGRRGAVARRAAIVAVAIVLAAVGILVVLAPDLMVGRRALASLRFRWYFTQASVRIVAVAPVFGIGLARFREVSGGFMNRALLEVYPTGENAHNYFMQVAAELGVTGFAAFAAIVCIPVLRGVRALGRGPVDLVFAGIVGAAIAFLITALTGHPFLTMAVTYPLWIVLGLCVEESERRAVADGASSPRAAWQPATLIAAVAVVLIAVSLPERVRAERGHINFSNIAYGVHGWEQNEAGLRYRWTGRRARFFVPSSTRAVEMPVRALRFDRPDQPTDVQIDLDGRTVNRLVLRDASWQQMRLLIPPSTGRRFREIDLTIAPTWSPAVVTPGSTDARELGIIVGEMKITKAGPDEP
jgi:O-antigen ligase/polysaccharide polymerase Wzy-like membrane protein